MKTFKDLLIESTHEKPVGKLTKITAKFPNGIKRVKYQGSTQGSGKDRIVMGEVYDIGDRYEEDTKDGKLRWVELLPDNATSPILVKQMFITY